jgi:hypothetical protein
MENWPRSGPGGCGKSGPSSFPPNPFIGVRAKAKDGVSAQDVLWSIPKSATALWCVRLGAVDKFTNPPSLALSFFGQASDADIESSVRYLQGTKLFSSVKTYADLCNMASSKRCNFPVETHLPLDAAG